MAISMAAGVRVHMNDVSTNQDGESLLCGITSDSSSGHESQ